MHTPTKVKKYTMITNVERIIENMPFLSRFKKTSFILFQFENLSA